MSLDTCLLDQPIIRYRRRSDRAVVRAALPALLAAQLQAGRWFLSLAAWMERPAMRPRRSASTQRACLLPRPE